MEIEMPIALWECCRPLNMALAFLAAVTGAVLTAGGSALGWPSTWLAGAATALALAAGNLWNDLADLREDAINRPGRPLPSGRLDTSTARRAAALLALASLGCALPVGLESMAWVAGCLALLAWYAQRGKQAVLAGNAAVALLSVAAVGLGALHAGLESPQSLPARALVPAVLAGLLHLMREVAKDAQDVAGDRLAGRRSLALVHGFPAVKRLLGQVAMLSLLPPLLALLFARDAAPLRQAHMLALGLAPLLLWRLKSTRLDEPSQAAHLSRTIKLLLAGGLLLYLVAALAARVEHVH